MPTIITHGIIGLAGSKSADNKKFKLTFWVLSILVTILPDFDMISFRFGVNYGDFFGHRGFSHSIVFALIVAALFSLVAHNILKIKVRKYRFFLAYFFILAISHSILDAFTDGGLGVAFFSPFDNARYFFPYTPIKVAPISPGRFFSLNGLKVLLSEFIYVWIPVTFITFVIKVYKRKSKPFHST
jgi:inner membrane protein